MTAPTPTGHGLSQEAEPGSPDLRLFLRVPPPAGPGQAPSRLARILGLDLYSRVLLGKRARTEMSFAAVLLLLVAAFELLAWSFTFNALWNGDVLYVGRGSIVAALVGALFASAVLWFERQFLVSDEPPERRRAAAVARLLFVLFAAFINAQSLELLVFRTPIDQRAHEEQLRAKAAVDLAEVERQEQADTDEAKAVQNQLTAEADAIKSRLDGERERLNTARVNAAAAAETLTGARDELVRLAQQEQAEPTSAAAAAAEKRHLQREIDRSTAARIRSNAQVPVSSDEVRRLEDAYSASISEAARINRERAARSDLRRALFGEWADRLAHSAIGESSNGSQLPSARNAAPGAAEALERARKWHYEYRRPNAFEQLRIPWDLALAHPPRWLAGSQVLVEELETRYGLHVPRPCVASGEPEAPAALPCDPLAWETEVTRSHVFLVTLISCHLLAVFIPLLVLVIKFFLLPQELRRYYSARHQAAAGDGDALHAAIVDQRAGATP